MPKDFDTLENSNRSGNPSIHEVSDPARRQVLQGGLSVATALLLGGCASGAQDAGAAKAGAPHAGASSPGALLGFQGVPPSSADTVVVPPGYAAEVIGAWGDPVGLAAGAPAFKPDASNTAEEQAMQMGMHHDGMQFFPLRSETRGLLVMNHEYVDDGLLFPDGRATWTAAKVEKAQAAHGVSVIEVELQDGKWVVQRPSHYARRFTATTPFALRGPAAGHPMMRTAFDPAGTLVRGTLNNCASGRTPWGTYLSGEENFSYYFAGGAQRDAHQRRWGLPVTSWYRWPEHDERFDATRHPNEYNRFGWIVEIDPMDPNSTPVKRTALGRGAHEGAWVATTRDRRAVVYSGEDAAFEYIYKFVSRDPIKQAGHGLTKARANAALLDHGVLHVARFDADGRGRWLPLVFGEGPLTPANGFADQGEVLIKSRQASDALGATKMDRPEWLAIDQTAGEVFCSLTNNSARGAAGQPAADAANPRVNNVMGQIIRWKEDGDFDATSFSWSHLLLAGDAQNTRPEARGTQKGDAFGCPDGLVLDDRGLLWIQTDAHSSHMHRGEFQRIGNNQMLACDPRTGEVRRFLTGPNNCEIAGATFTPDMRTLFVNVQHPGEPPSDRSDPAEVTRYSRWPDGGRPRSATLAIRRLDGGVIGT